MIKSVVQVWLNADKKYTVYAGKITIFCFHSELFFFFNLFTDNALAPPALPTKKESKKKKICWEER